MKVLLLSPFAGGPLYGGAVVRIHHLARHLAAHHRLWWARRRGPGGPPVHATVLETPTSRWRQLIDPATLLRLRDLVRRERIEVVVASSVLTGLHGPLLKRLTGCRLVFDDHNVEYIQATPPVRPLMYVLERWLCRSADIATCVSAPDRSRLIDAFHLEKERVLVVPNGADVPSRPVDTAAVRRALGVGDDERMLLFFGVLGYRPNARAVDALLDDIVPRLLARRPDGWRLVVAGTGAEAWSRRPLPRQVRFTGLLDDVAPAVQSADVVVAPLREGGGTRIKILEAVAAGRPVVTTSAGVEGLDLALLGDGVRVRDDWDGFTDEVNHILDENLSVSPSGAFLSQHAWSNVFARTWPF